MLTILIFTYNRDKYLKQILNDLVLSKNFKQIRLNIVFYGVSGISNDIYFKKLKKFENINFFLEKKIFIDVEKFIKYSKKIKSKFLWILSDDDRIRINSVSEILSLLKKNKNISGVSLPYISRKKINKKRYYLKEKKLYLKNFNIIKNFEIIGLRSAQIYNLKLLKNFFNKKNSEYFTAYIHTNFLIYNFKNWKVLNTDIVIFRFGNLDNLDNKRINLLEDRLNSEFRGYLPNLKKNFPREYPLLFDKIFFTHIISWLALNLQLNGRISSLNVLLNNKKLFTFNIKVFIFTIILFIMPKFFISLIKKVKFRKNQ